MAGRTSNYEKFSGRGFMSPQTTYLGGDHILVIEGFYKESYRRLNYNDIEAILICRTSTGLIAGILFLLCSLLFFGLMLANFSNEALWIFLGLSLFFVILTVVQFYGGGTAVFGVKTAVQTVTLYGINSVRKSELAEDQLTAKIERVQGKLTVEDLQEALEAEKMRASDVTKSTVQPGKPPPVRQRVEKEAG